MSHTYEWHVAAWKSDPDNPKVPIVLAQWWTDFENQTHVMAQAAMAMSGAQTVSVSNLLEPTKSRTFKLFAALPPQWQEIPKSEPRHDR